VARPVVDRLEVRLAGQALVVRLNVASALGSSLAGRYGVRGVPTMLVFDGTGEVIYSRAGLPNGDEITTAVEQTLDR